MFSDTTKDAMCVTTKIPLFSAVAIPFFIEGWSAHIAVLSRIWLVSQISARVARILMVEIELLETKKYAFICSESFTNILKICLAFLCHSKWDAIKAIDTIDKTSTLVLSYGLES